MARNSRFRGQPRDDRRGYYGGRDGSDDRYSRRHRGPGGAGPGHEFADEDAGFAESSWYEDNFLGEIPQYLGESFNIGGYGAVTNGRVDVRRHFGAGSDYGDNRPGWNEGRAASLGDRHPAHRGGHDPGHRYQYREDSGPAAFAAAEGIYRGHGPKGYSRKDERILEDVSEALAEDPYVDARGIEIEVKDGIVTLQGDTPTRQMKHRAEDRAEACSGVKDIQNHLRIVPADARSGGGSVER